MTLQFDLRRLIVGTASAAIPFAILPAFGRLGISVAIVIAICCLAIALLAKTYQLRAIGRLLSGGLLGWIFGLLFVPPHLRSIEQAQAEILFVIIGLVGGAICALPVYCEYETRVSGNSEKTTGRPFSQIGVKTDRTKR